MKAAKIASIIMLILILGSVFTASIAAIITLLSL